MNSLKQAYWDLLHAEHRLSDFADHLADVSGLSTRRYNTEFASAVHRVRTAKIYLPLCREEKADLDADFETWLKERKGEDHVVLEKQEGGSKSPD